jgi:hypothetical protein
MNTENNECDVTYYQHVLTVGHMLYLFFLIGDTCVPILRSNNTLYLIKEFFSCVLFCNLTSPYTERSFYIETIYSDKDTGYMPERTRVVTRNSCTGFIHLDFSYRDQNNIILHYYKIIQQTYDVTNSYSRNC